MIIGDGVIIGSGGGSYATIVVTSTSGATVTCTTPSGIVLTAIEVSGTWTFANLGQYGTYIVTSVSGGTTKTENVVVDEAKTYSVTIS